jgi:hypothetical protein
MPAPTRRLLLVWLLGLSGAVQMLGALAVFLPTAWMAWTHAQLGLGEFPDAPLTQYLTRSIAALYCLHGGVMIVAARDVDRFRPLVRYLGWGDTAFGLAILAIDLAAPMPRSWTVFEGPPVAAVGLTLLWLSR